MVPWRGDLAKQSASGVLLRTTDVEDRSVLVREARQLGATVLNQSLLIPLRGFSEFLLGNGKVLKSRSIFYLLLLTPMLGVVGPAPSYGSLFCSRKVMILTKLVPLDPPHT